jgi:hypothetical protein
VAIGVDKMIISVVYMLMSPDKIHPVGIGVVEMITSAVNMLTSPDYTHPVPA